MNQELKIHETAIPGLLEIDLPVHGDNRGWFKENFQQAKLEALGFPTGFKVIQNNVSFNDAKGVTRGIHAEPWDKYISMAYGKVFGVWVDLREGNNFGTVVSFELSPEKAVFVPKGVGNAYQTLAPNTAYTYLVNAHWSPEASYTFVNLFDPELKINWPISQDQAILSDKDVNHPPLKNVTPFRIAE